MLKRNLARLVATLSLLMLVGSADAKANGHDMDDDDGIVGTWLCSAIRAGTVLRPIIWQFRGDGTFDYASGTTVNTDNSPPPPTARSPVYKSGFAGRGGGHGEWGRGEDHDVFTYHSVEILHNDRGNGTGIFNVETTALLTPDGQLCSGWPGLCPDHKTTISLSWFQFAGGVDGTVVGQDILIPTGTNASILCNRLSVGAFPAGPNPAVTPAVPLVPTH